MKTLRRLLLSVIGLTVGLSGVLAQDMDTTGYCPLTPGMTLRYANYDPQGNLTSTYVLHVREVDGNLYKGTVVYDQYFYDGEGEPLFGEDAYLPMEVTVGGPQGNISRMSEVSRVMKVKDLMSKGDASNIPTVLTAGTTIPDGSVKVSVGKITTTLKTTGRQVVKSETVTVQAGTFETFLISETQTTRALVSWVEKVETWYARGIGCVKQNVYDKKGRLDHTQELISLEFEN